MKTITEEIRKVVVMEVVDEDGGGSDDAEGDIDSNSSI